MPTFFSFLASLGININENSNPYLLFVCVILVLSIIVFLCLINVLLYFIINIVIDKTNILNSLSTRLPNFIIKIINLYKNTRKYYIIYELIFALFVIGSIIYLCGRLAYGLN